MGYTAGTDTGYPLRGAPPTFYYEMLTFTISELTDVQVCLLDINGIRHLTIVIENSGATYDMDININTFADKATTPDDASLIKAVLADETIGEGATKVVQLDVGSHTRATDPDAAPAVPDALPARWLEIEVAGEDGTAGHTTTGNIWITGLYQ